MVTTPAGHAVRLVSTLALVLAACPASRRARPPPPEVRLTLFASAALEGTTEPCGCSANMLGGLARAASVLHEAAAAGRPVFFFDAGDGLFPKEPPPAPAASPAERRARAIAQALTLMGLTLRAPGPADDARGSDVRADLRLPELAPGTVRVLEAGGHRLGVVAARSVAAASALAHAARRDGAAFVLALLHDSFESARPHLDEARGVDLLLAARPEDGPSAERDRVLSSDGTRLVQVGHHGRSLLRVDLVLRGAPPTTWLSSSADRALELRRLEERIELLRAEIDAPGASSSQRELRALRQSKLEELIARRAALVAAPLPEPGEGNLAALRFVPIEGTLPEEPRVAAILREAERDIGALNLAWAGTHGQDCGPPTPTTAGVAGSDSCGACHPEALAVWRGSRHPHAYEALIREGKQYHLDCLPCHVTGWQQPGGVCRVDKTENRREVGCESCHGPGSLHLVTPTKDTIVRPEASTCLRCHDHENSPHFAYETYLQQIRAPGHGLPKAK